jgi:hypothetical protein
VYLQGKLVALGESKAPSAKDYEVKRRLLHALCRKLNVKCDWFSTAQKEISRTSRFYINAKKYHHSKGGKYELVTVLNKTAHYFADVDVFIEAEAGNELFKKKCAHCGKDMLTRHLESTNHRCGSRNTCLTNTSLRKNGKGLCATCHQELPLSTFMAREISCRDCVREVDGLSAKICLRCSNAIPLGAINRICAECDDANCSFCGKELAVKEAERYVRFKKGLPIFCSSACNLKFRSKNETFTLRCSTCKNVYNSAGHGIHCRKCRTAKCKLCKEDFMINSATAQKIRALVWRHGIPFNKLKNYRYRCGDCLTHK